MRGKGFISNRLKSSSNMSAAILLVLAIAVVVTLLSERHYVRWDVTATGEHTLSEETIQVLKSLEEPVHMKAFVREGQSGAKELERLLASYQYVSPNITFELIDADRNPSLTMRYNISSLNTTVLEGYDRTQDVKIADEEHLTNGLIRLSKSEKNTVYWVTGHGERGFQGAEPQTLSNLKEDLGEENFVFEELYLMQSEVPEGASLVVVAAPEKPLFPEEVKSLGTYLNGGGRIVVFLEPFENAGLKDFLSDYGIIVRDDVIIDKMSRVMGGDFLLPMVAQYGSHEITRDFKLTSFFEIARSVDEGDSPPNVRTTSLAMTSPESWAETDQEALKEGRVGFEEGKDRMGPVSLAVIAELTPQTPREDGENSESEEEKAAEITGEGKMVVFGDADFASNKYFQTSGNADFIKNTINYMVDRGDLITIKKEPRGIDALMLTRGQGQLIFWVPVVAIPLCVLGLGIVVYVRRRSR